jgi:TP901 family phage tail tape measure protein
LAQSSLTASLILNIRALGVNSLKAVNEEFAKVAQKGKDFKKALEFGATANQAAEGLGKVQGALTGLLSAPIEEFSKFESAMARAKSKMGEVTTTDFAAMKKAALEAGSSTSFSATEAADGLGEMAAAGFSVSQQMAALPKVLQLAQAGEVGVGRATAIAASAMAQFGLGAGDVGMIGNTLLKASNASTIGLDEIAESLKYVGPVASAAGLDLKETSKFIALLGNAGIESSSAGTALRGMFASMAAPTSKATKALKVVGLTAKDLTGNVKTPINLLKTLGERFESKGLSKADRLGVVMKVFGRETASAVMSLIDAGSKAQEGGTAFEKMGAAMADVSTAMDDATAVLGNTTAAKLKRLTSQVDALKVATGEQLAPALLEAADRVRPWLTSMGEWIAKNPKVVANLGQVTVGLIGVTAALKGLALTAGFFGTNVKGGQMALSALGAPLRLTAKSISAVDLATQSLGGSLGKTTVAATYLFGAAGALAMGWQIGTMLDELIGKTLDLENGLLSAHVAIKAGQATQEAPIAHTAEEAAAFSKEGVAYQTPQQAENWRKFMDFFTGGAYSGNLARNKNETEALQATWKGTTPSTGEPFSAVPGGQFNAVSGQIEVTVSDDRVKVRTQSKGGVPLRTGQAPPPGAR